MLSAPLVAAIHGIPTGLVSLGVGLWGVMLARWVFVNRENRLLPRRQSWRETLPLTLIAMTIAGVTINERQLGLSAAAFTGLGVGWAAVLLLDVLGDRITAAFRAGFAFPAPPQSDISGHDGKMIDADVSLPRDMVQQLEALHREPGVYIIPPTEPKP